MNLPCDRGSMPPDLADYIVNGSEKILTPALMLYPSFVDGNIKAAIRVLRGNQDRWRPHIKTAKMPWVIRRLMDFSVDQFKCATTLELRVACEVGARDVLVAYPMVGANARRVLDIAKEYTSVKVSVLVEDSTQSASWRGTSVGIFVDVNPGMNRTGIGEGCLNKITELASTAGGQFRGIHYYDGHVTAEDRKEREKQACSGYERLMKIIEELEKAGLELNEVITSGTPSFPYAATYLPFDGRKFVHRVSPGTVVFHDMTSASQFPADYGFRPAALVMATVVSRPAIDTITCNAGHKSVSADAGIPTCSVVGWPGLEPLKPSEEHLPIQIRSGLAPEIGDVLYLLPRHVCPTVNNFDKAILVDRNEVLGVEAVLARGHEMAIA